MHSEFFLDEKQKKNYLCLKFQYITFVRESDIDKSCVQCSIRAGGSPEDISNVNDLTIKKCEYHK